MRILLDENMYPGLAPLLVGHDARTVKEMGWQSIQNGQLLALAKDAFDCLITLDKGIAFQHSHQNIELRILIIRIPDNRKETQVLAVPHILAALSSTSAEKITHLTPP